MIRPFTCLAVLLAAGSGLYLYTEKHRTTLLDAQIDKVVSDTGLIRARTSMLQAEWALLNQPDRLASLAGRFLPTLQPIAPTQFVQVADLDKRLPPLGPPPSVPSAPSDAPGSMPGSGAQPATPAAPLLLSSATIPLHTADAAAVRAADAATAPRAADAGTTTRAADAATATRAADAATATRAADATVDPASSQVASDEPEDNARTHQAARPASSVRHVPKPHRPVLLANATRTDGEEIVPIRRVVSYARPATMLASAWSRPSRTGISPAAPPFTGSALGMAHDAMAPPMAAPVR